ncbi:MAG: hypothetical protein ACR2PI_11070 [Hyphomicrobiaceae bacterium]
MTATGVGVTGISAELIGLNPVELAFSKATNPREFTRRMNDDKRNPVKYVGKQFEKRITRTG